MRDGLRDVLSLCRLRAVARLSQIEAAKEESLKLLPRLFLKVNADIGDNLKSKTEFEVHSHIELRFTLDVEESSLKNVLLRLSVLFLESTECFSEVIRVCETLKIGVYRASCS